MAEAGLAQYALSGAEPPGLDDVMSDLTTGAMQEFDTPAGPHDPGRGPLAGLVLLYAEDHAHLPAAWPLTRRRIVLGRGDEADLQIRAAAVSRVHAEVVWEAGRWLIRDLGSRNGTFLDGRRIQEAELEAGQELRIGDALFKFVPKHAELYSKFNVDGTVAAGAARRSRATTSLRGGFCMDRIASEIERIAPTTLTVLVLGESGTGKEVLARELHRLSGRSGSFSAVNCAAIPATLIESELFGYKRGAFSGAERDKPGLIRATQGGTLLLDEIGDMPPAAQTKLLRVLQNKEVFPLGATAPESVDVRVVAATHRDLDQAQRAGDFRTDLYARLNEYQLRLPPLRERKEDIYQLVLEFLRRSGRPDLRLNFLFMFALLHCDWPYNMRELEACIKRCVALTSENVLDQSCLPEAVLEALRDYGKAPEPLAAEAAPSQPAAHATGIPSEEELRHLLNAHQGNVAAVSRQLGKARMQIHRWMKRYGIDVSEYRSAE